MENSLSGGILTFQSEDQSVLSATSTEGLVAADKIGQQLRTLASSYTESQLRVFTTGITTSINATTFLTEILENETEVDIGRKLFTQLDQLITSIGPVFEQIIQIDFDLASFKSIVAGERMEILKRLAESATIASQKILEPSQTVFKKTKAQSPAQKQGGGGRRTACAVSSKIDKSADSKEAEELVLKKAQASISTNI